MDTLTILALCRKRWYVFVPMLVLTALVAVGAASQVSSRYQSAVTISILPNGLQPAEAPQGTAVRYNPFDRSGGGRLLLGALNERISAQTSRNAIVAGGGTDEFTSETPNNGGTTTYTVVADSPGQVTTTLELIAAKAAEDGRAIQLEAAAPQDQLLVVRALAPPDVPEELPAGAVKVLALSLLLGVVASIMSALVAEVAFNAFARRPRATKTVGSGPNDRAKAAPAAPPRTATPTGDPVTSNHPSAEADAEDRLIKAR